jgi:hypothetical protein
VLHIRIMSYRKVIEMDVLRRMRSPYSVFKHSDMIVCKPFKLIW